MALLAGLLLRWRTARHLRPVQLWCRARRRLGLRRPRHDVGGPQELRRPTGPWVRPVPREAGFCGRQQWTCQGTTLTVAAASAWHEASADRLLLYHLNYLDDLGSAEAVAAPESLRWLVQRWIAENPPRAGLPWEPYPVSRRLVNVGRWLLAGAAPDARTLRSLAEHAAWLEVNLERDVSGNHLLANAKALCFAGALLRGPAGDRWWRLGNAILRAELGRQVLADGGHYERSPMYHASVADDLLDVLNVARWAGLELAVALEPLAERMLDWLDAMTHPDGAIAQFNDAALDGAPGLEQLRAYAGRLGLTVTGAPATDRHLAASGYVRACRGPFVLLADIGEIGPDEQPGHAHADTLGFELSVAGRRVLIDPGVSTYTASPVRASERGTAAHNTVCIDGADSSEVWGAFRCARRARILATRVELDVEAVIGATHDGYRRLRVPVSHGRTWHLDAGSLRIVDQLIGTGTHHVSSGLLLHPELAVAGSGAGRFSVSGPGLAGVLEVQGDPQLDWQIVDAWYAPRFGTRLPTRRIAGNGRVPAGAHLVTRLSLQPAA